MSARRSLLRVDLPVVKNSLVTSHQREVAGLFYVWTGRDTTDSVRQPFGAPGTAF